MAYAVWANAHHTMNLTQGWSFTSVAPGQINQPSELTAHTLNWMPALVPGTVAAALRAAGKFKYGEHDFDASDYWFRCADPLEGALKEAQHLLLNLDGLATLADVYWDNALLLSSENMFTAHTVDISQQPRTGQLFIHFKAVHTALAVRRPRPRWKTRLVAQQQLRWVRTTLLGRIPGWSPPVAPVGPFRAISLEVPMALTLKHADVCTSVVDGDGQVAVTLRLQARPGVALNAVVLTVGNHAAPLALTLNDNGECTATGTLTLPQPALWWPHTHGEPALHAATATLTTSTGVQTLIQMLDLGKLGFRALHVNQDRGAFAVHVNGIPVFCRGACWTPTDMVSLTSTDTDLRPTLTLARDAGMNMLRVGGTMVYEADAFYQLCDELGILVWHDFMFANMDYPVGDDTFATRIEVEARQFLGRVQSNACIAVLCGNSEIEQQSAMLGLTRDQWSNSFFAQTLPALCAEIKPDAVYWPSSPSGGVLPFQVDHAVSHYYGVGAYLRPLEDARRAGVRFTTECLGFSNVPDEASVDELLKHGGQAAHHPAWKARVPRDGGAGWDFEDVRDHYTAQLFRVDTMRLRYADMPRYLALSRVTTGEVIAQTVSEWRRTESACQGALLWFLRDLWLGAGWGLIDALGQPKAAYWYARRAMKPLTVFLSDEGLNGLEVHIVNDGPTAFTGTLALNLFRNGETCVAQAHAPVQVPAHGSLALRADSLFEHFLDTAYAYRFGPAGHHLAVATVQPAPSADGQQHRIAPAFHHTLGLPNTLEADLGLQAVFQQAPDGPDQGTWQIHITSRKFTQSLFIDVPGFRPDDNYFHMAPGSSQTVKLTALRSITKMTGTVTPLNAELPTKITLPTLTASSA